jgi:hypothetical protein
MVICFWGAVAIFITASARPKYLDPDGNECDPNVIIRYDYPCPQIYDYLFRLFCLAIIIFPNNECLIYF